MVVLTQVKINSLDVGDYLLNYEIESVYGDAIDSAEIQLKKSVSTVVTLEVGQTVEIWRGYTTATDLKVFSGYVEKYEPEHGTFTITAKNKFWDLIRKQVNKEYISSVDTQAGVISEIWKDLVTTYGGLTADSTSVQSSGTVKILEKFRCRRTDIFERCKALATAIDWQQYYHADTNLAYFEPKGFTTNSTILTVGTNVIGLPKWEYDATELVNDLIVSGAFQEIETTETGRIGTTTGYTTASIALAFTPISVKVFGDSVNPPTTLKVGGQPDTSGTDFDYFVDKSQKKIFPRSGTTFANNDYYEIRYSHPVKIPIHLTNQTSIDTYRRSQKEIILIDILSVADAEVRGYDYLGRYSIPFIRAVLKAKCLSTIQLTVGDLIRVVDSISPKTVDRNLVITRHRYRYPSDYEEIEVGDKVWRLAEWQSGVEERFRRLLEENLQDEDILIELIDADNASNSPINTENRYSKVLTQTVVGTNLFILGHSTYGILGTGRLGATDLGAETNHFVMQHDNDYLETFIDDDFEDTSTSTAAWSTIGTCAFTAGQTARSLAIDYNNSTITTAKATFTGSGAGTPTYYLTANGGSNWESVTSGVAHTFSNTGTDLRWRIDVAGSTYTITKVDVENYH